MAKVAWLGTGMMGSGFVEALRRRGDDVTVWNRTMERVQPLARFGAHVAESPNEAVREVERVHIILSDDASVDELLARIAPDVPKNAVVVDHTTVAPKPTIARFAWCERAGLSFLHAPVFMSPQMCRESTGIMLCSGSRETFERIEAELKTMSGELWYLGDRVDKAAATKLLGNAMLLFVVAGLADVFALAKSAGLAPDDVLELFSRFNVGGGIAFRSKRIAEANFEPSFELVMARKDARLMLETAAAGGGHLAVLPAIAARMDEAIAAGHGREDMSILARESVVKTPQ